MTKLSKIEERFVLASEELRESSRPQKKILKRVRDDKEESIALFRLFVYNYFIKMIIPAGGVLIP